VSCSPRRLSDATTAVFPGLGRDLGVDMTDEQLTVARRHLDFHADRFGYANVEFVSGYIEHLAEAGIADASADLVVPNCVLNLSPARCTWRTSGGSSPGRAAPTPA
jgi:hypothetical protein